MGNYVTQQSDDEETYNLLGMLDETTPLVPVTSSTHVPSYHPTSLAFVNRLLDIVDEILPGRAGWLQRLVSYLFFGGFAALVNIAIFSTLFYRVRILTNNPTAHNLVANVIACEISIMANFIPNDYFTFRHLPGHTRSWTARCIRFQMTSIVGSFLTILIELVLASAAHVPAIIAQAIALILVLVYNFSFHHIFTYRHVKPLAGAS